MVFFFFLVPRSSLISITCPHGHLSLQPTGQLLEVSVREQYRHRIPVHLRMSGNHSISRVGQEGRTFNKKEPEKEPSGKQQENHCDKWHRTKRKGRDRVHPSRSGQIIYAKEDQRGWKLRSSPGTWQLWSHFQSAGWVNERIRSKHYFRSFFKKII